MKPARLALLGLLLGAIAAAVALRGRVDVAAVEGWITGLGPWAPVAYLALYTLGAVLFVPGLLYALAGGALFGPVWGSVWNLLGATLGATAAFLLARTIAAEWVERASGARLGRLRAGIAAEGWRFVALTRLVPLFPFNLLNYALGLTSIRLDQYVLASLVCMAPATIAYTQLGYAGREAAAGHGSALKSGLIALGAIAAVALVPGLVRRLRRTGAAS